MALPVQTGCIGIGDGGEGRGGKFGKNIFRALNV